MSIADRMRQVRGQLKACLPKDQSLSDRRGAVAIIAALCTPLMIGGLAIGVDVAYWRHRQAQLQIAADVTALSLAIDIGNNVRTQAALQTNGTAEAAKAGCSNPCQVGVTYPWNSDASAVRVVATDTGVGRFFSGIYGSGSRTLTGTATARTQSTGGTSTRSGSGCVLALNPTTAYAIRLDGSNPRTYFTGCEMISNSSSSQAILAQGSATIDALATTVGTGPGAWALNGGIITRPNPGKPATPDPYASTFATLPYKVGQFRIGYGQAGGFYQSECIEWVAPIATGGGGNVSQLQWGQDLRTLSGWGSVPDLNTRNYSTYIGSDGRRVHNFGGGGGRFCSDFIARNVVINLGPGVWFFNRDTTFDNATINATGSVGTTVNAMIPAAAGQPINGVTILRGSYNFNIINNSELHLRAPTLGPYAGVAMGAHADTGAPWSLELANNVLLEWSGLLYMPRSMIRSQGNAGLITLAGADGTASSGCSQIVSDTLMFGHRTYTGNYCADYGVKAWGNDTTSGWQVTTTGSGGGTGVGARLSPN